MKRPERPWEKRRNKGRAAHLQFRKEQEKPYSVPFVELPDGTRYYSDRFYLNSIDGEPTKQPREKTCVCGANNPPPLFDRKALIQSLDLKAVIMATYNLQPSYLLSAYPSLFQKGRNIPTLVMVSRLAQADSETSANNHESDNESDSPNQDYEFEMIMHKQKKKTPAEDDLSISTQPTETKEYAEIFVTSSPAVSSGSHLDELSEDVHFSEITTSWISPTDLPTNIVQSNGSVSDTILRKRKRKMGVHHPKFMILLEKSGSVIVVVSTSNLVSQHSLDGTWMQRFHPCSPQSATSDNTHKPPSTDKPDCPGRVLGHFMDCQTWAAKKDCMTPLGFLQKYLDFNSQSCQEITSRFDFSTSQTFLVPHVPGEYTASPTQESMFCYGRHFVSRLLSRLCRENKTTKPWIPQSLLSEKDRLIIQPTSLGGQWNAMTLSKVIASYIQSSPYNKDHDRHDEEDAKEEYVSAEDLLNQLDIVWPTDDWMSAIQKSRNGKVSVKSLILQNGFYARKEPKLCKETEVERNDSSFVFLSSSSFNANHLDCLSRMVLYEPSAPPQLHEKFTFIPHIKSVTRLFNGSKYNLQKDFGVGKSQEYLSWFLLTSACLSRGAQGEDLSRNGLPGLDADQDYVSYANFELGVLFCSRLQGKKSDRLYCWGPSACSCGENYNVQRSNKLVHLPIPYGLRPSSYMDEDPESLDFKETPYFHEIPKGTFVGNMKLTPLGRLLSK